MTQSTSTARAHPTLFVRNTSIAPRGPLVGAAEIEAFLFMAGMGTFAGFVFWLLSAPLMEAPWRQTDALLAGAGLGLLLHALLLCHEIRGKLQVRAVEATIDDDACALACARALAQAVVDNPSLLSVDAPHGSRFRTSWKATPKGLFLASLMQESGYTGPSTSIPCPYRHDAYLACMDGRAPASDAEAARMAAEGWFLPIPARMDARARERWARHHARVEVLFFDTPHLPHTTAHQRMALMARLAQDAHQHTAALAHPSGTTDGDGTAPAGRYGYASVPATEGTSGAPIAAS